MLVRLFSIVAAVVCTALILPLRAQDSNPDDTTSISASEPQQVPAPEQRISSQQVSFFGAFGRWFDASIADMAENLKTMQSKTATDAAAALVRMPSARVIAGRERCIAAANGAPDCRVAAENICSSSGLTGGQSLDIQSAEKCPARVWLSGRQHGKDECSLETFVLRAICQ